MRTKAVSAIGLLALSAGSALAAIRPPSSSNGAVQTPSAQTANSSKKPEMFVLKDTQRTGAWVVAMPVPDGYVGDGKAFWVSEPSCPFHWDLLLTSRDGQYKAYMNDPRYFCKVCYGDLENAPEFSTADGFAEFLMQSVARTYGLSKVQVYHASYTPRQPKETPATRQTRETCHEYYWYDFKAVYTGERPNGQVASVSFLAEVELNIPYAADSFCMVTMNCARSCCYPPGAAKRAQALMKFMLGTVTPNLEFAQYVANLSRGMTQQWVRSQDESQRQFNEVMSRQNASYDKWFSEWDRVIRETDTLSTGGGETYSVPWGADHSYVDDSGRVTQKSNEEFLGQARRNSRTVDEERQHFERERRTLRKLAPLVRPESL